MQIYDIAKEMANKYEEKDLKWFLVLKRLECQGYMVIKKEDAIVTRDSSDEKHICTCCKKEIVPYHDGILEYHGEPYCHHCAFKLMLERHRQ